MSELTVVYRMKNKAISMYNNFAFVSFCEFAGKVLAAGVDGIYEVDTGDNDEGKDIPAEVEFVTDFGSSSAKKLRQVDIFCASDGYVRISTSFDGDVTDINLMAKPSMLTGVRKVSLYGSKNSKGDFCKINFGNTEGQDFSLDRIETTVVETGK